MAEHEDRSWKGSSLECTWLQLSFVLSFSKVRSFSSSEEEMSQSVDLLKQVKADTFAVMLAMSEDRKVTL